MPNNEDNSLIVLTSVFGIQCSLFMILNIKKIDHGSGLMTAQDAQYS